MSPRGALCLGLCLFGARAAPVLAQHDVAHLPPIPQGSLAVRLEPLVTGLDTPTDLASARDGSGRLFVTDLFGRIDVIDGGGSVQPTPVLDVTGTTDTGPWTAWGMTSIALHPQFAEEGSAGYGKVYTVRVQPPGTAPAHFNPAGTLHQSVVEEWRVDAANPNVIDVGSRREILRLNQDGTEHSMNQVVFGPEGMLYVSFGDGGNSPPGIQFYGQRARQMNNVFGKILRIDVDDYDAPGANGRYAVPQDNPFVGQAGALGEIYATGFRNPYRMSFDAQTGELYVGDVGQVSIEEVNRVVKGGNYGWNLKEGSFKYDYNTQFVSPDDDGTAERNDLIDPLGEYDHTQGRSVTGGFVYRGTQLPELAGKYVFGELGWSSGGAKLFYMDTTNGEIREFLLDPAGTALDGFYLYGFGQDEENELYFVGRRGGMATDTGMVVQMMSESRAWSAEAGGAWSSAANWTRAGVPTGVNGAAVLGVAGSQATQVDVDAAGHARHAAIRGGARLRASRTRDADDGRVAEQGGHGRRGRGCAARDRRADDPGR